MPIDPNIPLQVQRFRAPDRMGQLNQLMAIQQTQRANALQDYQMQKSMRDDERQATYRNALQGAVEADGSINYNALKSAAVGSGDIGTAMDVDRNIASTNTLKAQQELANLKTAAQRIDVTSRLLNGVTDEATHQQFRQRIGTTFGEGALANIPDTYDANWVKSETAAGMSAKEHVDTRMKDMGMQEARRHNLAMEARPVAGAVTINNASQTQEQKEIGKDLVKQYTTVRDAAENAQSELSTLSQLKAIDVNTGRLEELKTGIAGYAQALNIDPEQIGLQDPTNAEAFIGTAQKLVLGVMQAQKGPQTENDAKRIERTVANLGNTQAAKDFLIDSAIAVRQRDVERADFYDQWRADKGTFDGARKAWQMHIEKIPLLGNNPKTGRPVFYRQFQDGIRQANPDATDEQIMSLWRNKYGR